jgi:Domain of unknown function (DUF4190)
MGAVGMAAAPNDSQATLSLILGIVGLICCGLLAPVALFVGNSSRRRIQASGGALGGYGLATAGFVLGIIGTVLLALGIIIVIVRIIASASGASNG